MCTEHYGNYLRSNEIKIFHFNQGKFTLKVSGVFCQKYIFILIILFFLVFTPQQSFKAQFFDNPLFNTCMKTLSTFRYVSNSLVALLQTPNDFTHQQWQIKGGHVGHVPGIPCVLGRPARSWGAPRFSGEGCFVARN